mmetsp:Transcript_38031/g.101165  ORF Transcript_38031/g.101165 Transcript_38031/m.101165 type:complete len:319 (-) Transcript_38031:1569-2525(-)
MTITACPVPNSCGHVTSTSRSSISTSCTSAGISLPSSSVPHLTVNVTPPGDVSASSLPTSTPTCSPFCSVTTVVCACRLASSSSLAVATLRNTSSSVLIDSCTSTIPICCRRLSRSEKILAICSSWFTGALKCMYALVSSITWIPSDCSKNCFTATQLGWSAFMLSPQLTLTLYPSPKRLLSRTLLPRQRSRPLHMMPMRSPRMSASSMLCVVSTTVLSCLAASTTSQTWRRLIGSMPVVGSSRYTTSGLPMSATATDSLRFMPPEKAPARWLADCDSRTSSMRLSASAAMESARRPLMVPKSTRCSLADRLSHKMSN